MPSESPGAHEGQGSRETAQTTAGHSLLNMLEGILTEGVSPRTGRLAPGVAITAGVESAPLSGLKAWRCRVGTSDGLAHASVGHGIVDRSPAPIWA